MSSLEQRADLVAKAGKKVSNYARAANDWYVEDRRCVEDLLRVETFNGRCWDPAAGGGNIPKTLLSKGIHCIGSDLVDRGYGSQRDFMAVTTDASFTVENIVTNPPYGIAEAWVEKALTLATEKVAALLPLTFLEGKGRRDGIFARGQLARVWVSGRRISMPPGGLDIKASGGKKAYAWFIFEPGHTGPYAGGWI